MDEFNARARLEEIAVAQANFFAGNENYATDLDTLLDASPPYLDPLPANLLCAPYNYWIVSSGATYSVNAIPDVLDLTGNTYYFIDQTETLRFSYGGLADKNSTPYGQF